MKHLLIILSVLLIFSCSGSDSGQNNVSTKGGIEFSHDNLAKLKTQATKENKLIFMDCYTTWCGPCKTLSSKVFPQKIIGDYFNKNFINSKMDMEKGEGVDIAKTYNIKAYPTMLFLNSEGKIVHKIIGYHDKSELLEEAKKAMAKK